MVEVRVLSAQDGAAHLDELADVLADCVEGGASVNFMAPYSAADARQFFTKVLSSVAAGERLLLAAFVNGRVVGTVQLVTALPPNQPHRGEIVKLLVHRAARGQGIGRLLMQQAEECAQAAGKTLLVLDTASSAAERIYERLGWTRAGEIPNYCLLPDGTPCATVIFYKPLR